VSGPTLRYFYLLDPELALVQLFIRGQDTEALRQVVVDNGEWRTVDVPHRLAQKTSRLRHEGGRPPTLATVPPYYSPPVPATDQCIYCGTLSFRQGRINAFALPTYEPRGQTCPECGKTTISA